MAAAWVKLVLSCPPSEGEPKDSKEILMEGEKGKEERREARRAGVRTKRQEGVDQQQVGVMAAAGKDEKKWERARWVDVMMAAEDGRMQNTR